MPRALVVDDSAVVRHRVCAALAKLGIEVVQAGSFAEGRALDITGCTFALLDIDLGDGTGVDLAEIYRTRSPGLPIAFFTSESSGDIWTKAGAIGPRFSKADELDVAVDWAAAIR